MNRIRHIIKTLKDNPSNVSLIYELGETYEKQGSYKRALKCYKKALESEKDNITYKVKVAKMFSNLSNCQEAIRLIDSLATVSDNNSYLQSQLAIIYKQCNFIQEAINCLKKAILLEKNNHSYYLQLGNLLHKEGLVDESIACYKACLSYDINNCIALNNLAIALKDNHFIDESIKYFKNAISLCPDEPYIHWNYSHCLLISGNLKEGFAEYEWRLKKDDYKKYIKDYNRPTWRGEQKVKGLTILIYAEQGFGDTIQFVRYMGLLKEKGFIVKLQCHKELKELFSNMDHIEQVFSFQDEVGMGNFDLKSPLLSLPYLFKTDINNIPSKIPYLKCTTPYREKWRSLVNVKDTIKVGLVWAGSPNHQDDKNRSMDFDFLKPILRLKGFTFYSLQIGDSSRDCKSLIDLTRHINDFSDTAGFIDNLDIIISVDTATAHLSGAMGKKTFVLLPFTPDWRWMLNRDDSPWYPSIRLFRQTQRGDWEGVIKEVTKECMRLKY